MKGYPRIFRNCPSPSFSYWEIDAFPISKEQIMPIMLDYQLQEHIPHDMSDLPIRFYRDELAALPHYAGAMHWHPYFEIATAENGSLDYQVGQDHIILEAGDSIFVNSNMLHGIRQLSGTMPDPMPNIVFSGSVVAPESSTIYQKYIHPIVICDSLPFIVFRHDDLKCREVNQFINDTYRIMHDKPDCHELIIQRNISHIFEYIFRNLDDFPRSKASRIQLNAQIRIQKMLSYIHEHYTEEITLGDIATAANVSRSEAGRCFHSYIGYSPIEVLIEYRLQKARRLLSETTLTLQEISFMCGFHSENYFSRQFRKVYGYSPSEERKLGK